MCQTKYINNYMNGTLCFDARNKRPLFRQVLIWLYIKKKLACLNLICIFGTQLTCFEELEQCDSPITWARAMASLLEFWPQTICTQTCRAACSLTNESGLPVTFQLPTKFERNRLSRSWAIKRNAQMRRHMQRHIDYCIFYMALPNHLILGLSVQQGFYFILWH